MNIHFSSDSDMWETPQAFFDKLDQKYHFTLDVCATKENAKCERYFTREEDGLIQPWLGSCYMNPPYGKQIKAWMHKAYSESQKEGTTVVCLIPSRTDTRWFHDYAMKGDIEFLRGRLKFGGHENSAPFPSAIVVFR